MAIVRKVKRYNKKEKIEIEKLRRNGMSYAQIYELRRVPKSTLSTWFGGQYKSPYQSKESQFAHLEKARQVAVIKRNAVREQKLREVKERAIREIERECLNGKFNKKALLSLLYWAEGTKSEKHWGVKFANTDPELCRLYIKLLRESFPIDEGRIFVQLYLHYYHPIRKTRKFWSQLLNVPINQFSKVYIKKRSKTKRFRKNFMGICFINYKSNDLKKEIMEFAYAIKDRILSS
jgi:hypothetical protein